MAAQGGAAAAAVAVAVAGGHCNQLGCKGTFALNPNAPGTVTCGECDRQIIVASQVMLVPGNQDMTDLPGEIDALTRRSLKERYNGEKHMCWRGTVVADDACPVCNSTKGEFEERSVNRCRRTEPLPCSKWWCGGALHPRNNPGGAGGAGN